MSTTYNAQRAEISAAGLGMLRSDTACVDQLQRPPKDLRLSVIDQCNFRCTYCMPKEIYTKDYPFLSTASRLSFDQMVFLARAFVGLGVEKIRITGGDPDATLRQHAGYRGWQVISLRGMGTA